MFLVLCVCVFLQEMFPSYTAQVNWELSKQFSSALHTDYTLPDSFPQFSHSSSLVNIHFVQMKMVLRKIAFALDLLSGKAKLKTSGWSQCDCSGPLTCTYHSHGILSHGARESLHLCTCLEVLAAPEVQTMSTIIRWAQWSPNPEQPNLHELLTLAQSLVERHLGIHILLVNSQFLRVVWPCVDSVCHIGWF